MAAVAGIASAGVSLASGLFGASGGGAQAPPQWTMPNQTGAANNAYAGISGLGNYNTYAGTLPQVSDITQNLVNNPYAGNYLGGAQTASGLGQLQALNQYGTGQNLINTGQSLTPWANQVLQTGFDPQQALYKQTFAQNQAQDLANLSQSGVANTPYGAGVMAGANQNFNIAWQQAQLNNQLSALQGAGGALQTGGGLIGQGTGMQQTAPGQFIQSAQYPYATYGQIGSDQLNALNTYGQFGTNAFQIPQQSVQDWLSYVGQGTSANQVANNQALTQAGIQNMYTNQIGAGLQGLGNANWSKIFSGVGGGLGGASGGKS